MARPSLLLLALLSCLSTPSHAQDQAQEPKPHCVVELLEPEVGAEVSGTVSVSLRITSVGGARIPTEVCVGLGGSPWYPLEKFRPGHWKGEVDSTMVPNGEQLLRWQDKVSGVLPNVRVIPQTHKMMEML